MMAQRFERLPTIEWGLCNNPAFLVLAGFPPLAENRGWTDVGRISETRARLRAISGPEHDNGPSAGQIPTTAVPALIPGAPFLLDLAVACTKDGVAAG